MPCKCVAVLFLTQWKSLCKLKKISFYCNIIHYYLLFVSSLWDTYFICNQSSKQFIMNWTQETDLAADAVQNHPCLNPWKILQRRIYLNASSSLLLSYHTDNPKTVKTDTILNWFVSYLWKTHSLPSLWNVICCLFLMNAIAILG